MRRVLFLLLALLFVAQARATEPVRRAQEELRRRNLFFGDVDGRESPSFEAALKLYQAHKGFDATGRLDPVTAQSLGLETSGGEETTATKWPDVPVLKSDVARDLPPEAQAALAQKAVANLEAEPSPEAPAESPSQPQDVDPQEMKKFVEDYLRDNEANDLARQLKYYDYPVDYFDHGSVGKEFVTKDNRNYMRRWPDRHYQLEMPVKFAAGPKEGETLVEFPLAFEVRNGSRVASGRTRNFWTVKASTDGLKIIAIREQHLRE